MIYEKRLTTKGTKNTKEKRKSLFFASDSARLEARTAPLCPLIQSSCRRERVRSRSFIDQGFDFLRVLRALRGSSIFSTPATSKAFV